MLIYQRVTSRFSLVSYFQTTALGSTRRMVSAAILLVFAAIKMNAKFFDQAIPSHKQSQRIRSKDKNASANLTTIHRT